MESGDRVGADNQSQPHSAQQGLPERAEHEL